MSAIQKHRRLLSEAVRAKRKQAGFSQEKLAEKANLPTAFVSRIAWGVESPSVDNQLKIARVPQTRYSKLGPAPRAFSQPSKHKSNSC